MKAVVIGGSIAGLAAVAALRGRASEIVLVERRPAPEGTASVAAQGALPHVLLGGGAEALDRLVPGFVDDLAAHGALISAHGTTCRWWAGGATRTHLPDLGVRVPMSTRALVETRLRTLVAPGARVLHGTAARGLVVEAGRVRGVRTEAGDLDADLVVDTSGRGSATAEWLVAPPPASSVRVDLTYTGVEVRREAGDIDGGTFAVVQNSPQLARAGVALRAEGERWQIVLGGYFGDAAEPTPEGMLAFARSLPDPVVATLLGNEWLSRPVRFRFRCSRRRHWERMPLPAGLVALGDAVASFNPLYGQGMTSAAQQAEAFAACLDRYGNTPRLPRAVAKAAARIVANPWLTATGGDFVYSRTEGRKVPGTDVVNAYLGKVFRAAAVDDDVNRALSRVQQMLAPPASLFAPPVLLRVRRAAKVPGSSGRVAAAAPGRSPGSTLPL